MVAYLFGVSVAFEIKEETPTDIQAVYKLAIDNFCTSTCPCGFEGSRAGVTGLNTVQGGPTKFQDCPKDLVYFSQYDRGAIIFNHFELDYHCHGFGSDATPTNNLFYFYDVNKVPTKGNDCLVHYRRLASVSTASFA